MPWSWMRRICDTQWAQILWSEIKGGIYSSGSGFLQEESCAWLTGRWPVELVEEGLLDLLEKSDPSLNSL